MRLRSLCQREPAASCHSACLRFCSFAGLKEAIENGTQTTLTNIEQDGANDRKAIFQRVADAFSGSQDAMLEKAQSTTGAISAMYGMLAGVMGGVSKGLSGALGGVVGTVQEKVSELQQKRQDAAWQEIMDTLSEPVTTGKGSSGSKGSSSSGKDWYETQIDNLKKLEDQPSWPLLSNSRHGNPHIDNTLCCCCRRSTRSYHSGIGC